MLLSWSICQDNYLKQTKSLNGLCDSGSHPAPAREDKFMMHGTQIGPMNNSGKAVRWVCHFLQLSYRLEPAKLSVHLAFFLPSYLLPPWNLSNFLSILLAAPTLLDFLPLVGNLLGSIQSHPMYFESVLTLSFVRGGWGYLSLKLAFSGV